MTRLEFYRYRVARPGYRVGLNRYGWQLIGVAVVIRQWCYAIKWARAR